MEKSFILPIKNLHGSNFESLQEEYINAMDSVRNSIDAISKIDFNSRDYSDMNQFQSAKKQRMEMISNLQNVFEYLEAIAIELN